MWKYEERRYRVAAGGSGRVFEAAPEEADLRSCCESFAVKDVLYNRCVPIRVSVLGLGCWCLGMSEGG